jgi:hypothetical protein
MPMPLLRRVRKIRDRLILNALPARARFSYIFQTNLWGGKDSVSGWGSDQSQTAVVRAELPDLLSDLEVSSLLDAPCGDLHWIKQIELPIHKYIGADIVPRLIASNRENFGTDRRQFLCADLRNDDLPRVDAILCRDCLVHLSFRDGLAAIRNIVRSGATYLLTTSFPDETENRDIFTGDWRRLNLERPPFNFPPPIKSIVEATYPEHGRKCLSVWKCAQIVRM